MRGKENGEGQEEEGGGEEDVVMLVVEVVMLVVQLSTTPTTTAAAVAATSTDSYYCYYYDDHHHHYTKSRVPSSNAPSRLAFASALGSILTSRTTNGTSVRNRNGDAASIGMERSGFYLLLVAFLAGFVILDLLKKPRKK